MGPHTRSLSFLLGIITVVFREPVIAAQWTYLRTPEFELYTTNSQAKGRELIELLDRTWAMFNTLDCIRAQDLRVPDHTPVRIIALSSRDEYAPFRLNPIAFAYFRHTGVRNDIVLQDIQPEHQQAIIHEYAHLVFRQTGLRLPLWLNEGGQISTHPSG